MYQFVIIVKSCNIYTYGQYQERQKETSKEDSETQEMSLVKVLIFFAYDLYLSIFLYTFLDEQITALDYDRKEKKKKQMH